MRTTARRLSTFTLLLLFSASVAGPREIASVSRLFVAEEKSRHPSSSRLGMIVFDDAPAGSLACATYVNSFEKPRKANRGVVDIEVEVTRDGASLETKVLGGGVENNVFTACVELETRLRGGDRVAAIVVFREFPRFGRGRGYGVFLDVI